MCVQYCGGAQYRGGCSVPWGVISTVEGVQYRGDIMSTVGGYLEYRGGVQYRGDIMINVGDILSSVGCSVPWGIS